MFKSLSDQLNQGFKKISGRGKLSEQNIKKALKDVRNALLEADVALPVVKEFIAKVRRRALGKEVEKSLNPGQAMIKIVKQELQQIMGEACEPLNLKVQPPAVILLAGLQGSGKTTTCAKLAKYLTEELKKKVLAVSADVYRPAAIEQLKILGEEISVDIHPSHAQQKPVNIAKKAFHAAELGGYDVLLVDTAGRLHVDSDMMDEVKQLSQTLNPIETLFVADCMSGQDAVNSAKAFHDTLDLTGVILTKTDGDARGGAALSIYHVTEKPIKFIGTGEKTDALEPFHPDRIASRILGMGDVLTLIEDVESKVDKEQSEKLVKKIQKGEGFTLVDFKQQMEQISKMGGLEGLMGKMPGMGNLPDAVKRKVNDKSTGKLNAIIDSMTPTERIRPEIIKGSRKQRIANGSGTELQDVNKLLKQFDQMRKMMKKMKGKGSMERMFGNMQGMLQAQNKGRPPY